MVLDIGGDVGALVLFAPVALVGHEIYICPVGVTGGRLHNVVRERRVGDQSVYAAVFPALAAGAYEVVPPAGCTAAGIVTVEGGAVATANCDV